MVPPLGFTFIPKESRETLPSLLCRPTFPMNGVVEQAFTANRPFPKCSDGCEYEQDGEQGVRTDALGLRLGSLGTVGEERREIEAMNLERRSMPLERAVIAGVLVG